MINSFRKFLVEKMEPKATGKGALALATPNTQFMTIRFWTSEELIVFNSFLNHNLRTPCERSTNPLSLLSTVGLWTAHDEPSSQCFPNVCHFSSSELTLAMRARTAVWASAACRARTTTCWALWITWILVRHWNTQNCFCGLQGNHFLIVGTGLFQAIKTRKN